jgi:hypothetical protein
VCPRDLPAASILIGVSSKEAADIFALSSPLHSDDTFSTSQRLHGGGRHDFVE